jgi:hypothetical protein
MRFVTRLMGAALVIVPVLLTQTSATARPCDILDGAPSMTVWAVRIAAFSPGSNAWRRSAASVDFARSINFTIRVGLRAAAALGIGTNY